MQKLAVGLMGFFVATPLWAGVVFDFDSIDYNAGKSETTSQRAYIDGDNLKMAVDASSEVIFRGASDEVIMVDHSKKNYTVIDDAMIESLGDQMSAVEAQMQEALKDVPPEQRAMMEQMMKQHMPKAPTKQQGPLVDIAKTGKKETRNGYATEQFVMTVNGRKTQELWITAWNNVEGGSDAKRAFHSMADFFGKLRDAMPSFAQGDDNTFEYLRSLDGFPVVTISFDARGNKVNESVLRGSEKADISATEFDAPSSYEQQQMPGM